MAHALPDYTIEQLESVGRFEVEHLTGEDAFALGTLVCEVIHEWDLSLSVDVVIGDYLAYRARLGTTGVGNDPWLAGKAAVAVHFGEPSLLVRLRQEATGIPFTDLDFDHDRMKAHGGSIPIFVGSELVGTVTTSGEPDVVDHEAAAEGVRRYVATLG